MTFIISNKEQQEKVIKLALPVFNNVENLLCIFNANGNKRIYRRVKNAVLDLNKLMFPYRDNVPTWNLQDMQNALRKIINGMPNKYQDDIKYEELQDYLELLNGPVITKTDFVDKLKQLFNNIGKNAKLRVF